ncbi:AAA family ATPase [Candidatus Nomurabacteria bacterium]|nr:AAA family ATPase [Candidatus Nomurabacteria bacterium]
MKIKETLSNNNESWEPDNGTFPIAIQCPFCRKTISGNPYLTFSIDEYGRGSCDSCKKITTWNEILEALGITIAEKNLIQEPKASVDVGVNFRLWSIGEIFVHDFGSDEWLVESLVSKQGVTVLSGNPGDFKTWVTIHIALCVSRHIPVFGKFKTIQGAVLIINEEDHLRTIKKRLELLGAKDADNLYYFSQSGIKVDNDKALDSIIRVIREKEIKFVVLDSLVRIHGQEENDAKGMSKVFSSLQKIIAEGASILFTHHHRKQQAHEKVTGQSMRGSSDILAAVDCHITIEKNRDEKDHLIISQMKLRQGEVMHPFKVEIIKGESGPSDFIYTGQHDEKKKKAEEITSNMLILIKDEVMCRADILATLREEFAKSAVENAMKLAEEAGLIQRVPKEELNVEERRKLYYRIPKLPTS